jgi:N,N'-diacetyllegionaminate synthase
LGVDVLEVHVTLSREMFGPDVPASITTSELHQLVEGIRFIERMNAHQLDKDELMSEMRPLRDLFTKSVVVTVDLPAGAVLTAEHLTVKKPGTGIPASNLTSVVGRTLRRSVNADQILQDYDLC